MFQPKLRSLFLRARQALRLSPRAYFHLSDQVQRPAPGLGAVVWVLARALCRFRVVDLAQVPATGRAQALRLQVAQLSPFADTGHCVVWQGGKALLWMWDAALVRQAMAEAGVAAKRAQVWPESLLYAPGVPGARLVQALQGFEAQIWDDGGALVMSRWWSAPPDAAEWLVFERDMGLPASQRQAQVPQPLALAMQLQPQLRSTAGGGGAPWRDERLAYAVLALALWLPTAWWGAGWLKASQAQAQAKAAQDAAAQVSQPLVLAREEALRLAGRTQALAALAPYPSQLELMARVAGALPSNATQFREWGFREGKLKVVLVLQSEAVTSSTLVAALQKAGGLDNIQAVPGNDPKLLAINMDVVPLQARGPGHV